MEASSPLVGRDGELEFLMGHMSNAITGSGAFVLIGGEAGSGKTTICSAFERKAVQSGGLVLIGRCVPGSQMPYMPFREALRHQPSDPFAEPGAVDQSGKLLLTVLSCIEKIAKDHPLILRIEDLHWADSATIGMLHFLARNVRSLKVLIIGTYRPEDLHQDTNGEAHPLKEHLPTMKREGLCQELELNLLSLGETKRLVPLLLGSSVQERLMEYVANESHGNPLFAVEMVYYLVGSGQIVSKQNIWTLHLDKEQHAPTTIREVILARIDRLHQDNRKVLEAAAVIGERFEPDLINDIYHINRTQLMETLDVLHNDHRLVLAEGKEYRFSHEKVRQVVYESISRPRRKELHHLIGLQLEKRLPNEELLGPLSEHFLKAGDKKCIHYALTAGKLCHRRKAAREAKIFFLMVLGQTNDNDHVPERLEALESLGDLKNEASSLNEWYDYYDKFLAINQDSKARARVLTKAAECWDPSNLGDGTKARKLLDEAETLAEGDPRILAEIAFRRADLCTSDGQTEEALGHIEAARKLFEGIGDKSGTLMSRHLETLILRYANRLREAREIAEEQLLLARELEDPEPRLMMGLMAGMLCTMMGDAAPGKAYTTEVIDLASKLGMMWTFRLALINRAGARELEGDIEGARVDAAQALENAREYENKYHIAMGATDLGLDEAKLGNLESAKKYYDEAMRAAENFDSFPRSLLDRSLFILQAELLARQGESRASDDIYERLIQQAQDPGQRYALMFYRVRYSALLVHRGLNIEARRQYDEAMKLAIELDCTRLVIALGGQSAIYN